MFSRTAVCLMIIAAALPAAPPLPGPAAPGNLQVTSASKGAVALKWDAVPGATAYQVERHSESGAFAPVGPVLSDTSATDSKIDPYTTYTYHVKAVGAAASSASSEVKVGPPPAGFSYVLPTPKDAEGDFGVGLNMILDGNDDPVFAYIFRDPKRTSNLHDSILLVDGWDRAHYRWRQPQQIDVVGDLPDRLIPVSLARDASTGQLAMAWLHEGDVRYLAFSNDNGATWTKPVVPSPSEDPPAQTCSVALAGGKIYLAYFSNSGPLYITGSAADDASKWTRSTAPPVSGLAYRPIGHLALDSSGSPGIAVLATNDAGGTAALYWRPGSDPIKTLDSKGIQNESPDVRVSFAGIKPRMLYSGFLDEVDSHNIFFTTSDDGITWTPVVVIPNDGHRGMRGPLSITINSRGAWAVTCEDNGGNYDEMKCGWPKTARSADGRQWNTCSPNPRDLDHSSQSATAAYAGNNRLYLAFRSLGPTNNIVVWHEGATPAANIVVHK